MDQLIIPNWHPLLVHFTVALSVTAAVFLLLSKIWTGKQEPLATTGKWTLWAAAFVTILTIMAGIAAYGSVAHDDVAHVVMKTHRLWALITAGALLLTAFWAWRAKAVSAALVAASLLVAALVGGTGYLGAELVYRHGLGVMRLPDTSGAGHNHAGGAGQDHDHGPAEAGKEHSHDEGHDQDDAAAPAHDHDGGHEHGDMAAAVPADPAAVADALKTALKAGDADAVDALLADNVLILEGGHAQTSKADYMGGHMKSDMAFLPNIEIELLSREVGQSGDLAWVVSHTRSTGSYKDKRVDITSREFLLLRRQGETWKIGLIEWADK